MTRSKLAFLSAMSIFGTIGVFLKYIPLDASVIAFFRGAMGVLFLAAVMLVTRKKPDLQAIRKNLLLLFVSGAAIGANWILLFKSYAYTSIATSTVCYYLAPLFLLLAAPLLGEKLTPKKILCIGIALIGLVCVSGVIEEGLPDKKEITGLLLALGAALLYATVMLLNKRFSPIPAYDKTVLQLGFATIVLLPYLLMTKNLGVPQLTGIQWLLLILVGVLHTGVAYAMYFGAIKDLSAKTIAIFSYVDPMIAVVLSTCVLREEFSTWDIVGTALILGSALYSELPERK